MAETTETTDGAVTETPETTTPTEETSTTTEETSTTTEETSTTTEETSDTEAEYTDFTLPEGMELDQELLSQAAPLFKEMNLSKEQAQKFVDLKAKEVQQQVEAHNARVQGWTEAVKNDKELGGDNFDKNIGIARVGIDKVGSPELKELMETYGIGSHPAVVKAFYKIGKLVQEDNPESGARSSDSKKSIVDRLYPSTKGE